MSPRLTKKKERVPFVVTGEIIVEPSNLLFSSTVLPKPLPPSVKSDGNTYNIESFHHSIVEFRNKNDKGYGTYRLLFGPAKPSDGDVNVARLSGSIQVGLFPHNVPDVPCPHAATVLAESYAIASGRWPIVRTEKIDAGADGTSFAVVVAGDYDYVFFMKRPDVESVFIYSSGYYNNASKLIKKLSAEGTYAKLRHSDGSLLTSGSVLSPDSADPEVTAMYYKLLDRATAAGFENY